MILATITESIIIDGESKIITVKLRPVFEQLRLAKQSFNANIKELGGTLKTRSTQARQILKGIRPKINDIAAYGTRKNLLYTIIEPNFDSSKKSNVVGGTCLFFVTLNLFPQLSRII